MAAFSVVDTSTTTSSVTITVASAPPPPPEIPAGSLTVQRTWRYVEACICHECVAHREGRLYWGNNLELVPATCLTRNAPHEYDKIPPEPNTEEWRERSARGSKLLRGLLVGGEQLKVWDRFRSLIIRYKAPYDCGCDSCAESDAGATGLLLTPEDDREFGRWEFDSKGGLLHKRNLWPIDQSLWSYEDELISLLLSYRSEPKDFCGTGCRDRAGYYSDRDSYLRAHRIMRRITRFPDATNVAMTRFTHADQAGMFAGIF